MLRLFWIPSGVSDNSARIPAHSKPTIDPPPKPMYVVAPDENAIKDWNYTQNADNTVTLNYYIGDKTEVIVYGNYLIDGKTYKTRLANAATSAGKPYMFNGIATYPTGQSNNCKNINIIKFSDAIHTSSVTDMRYMFNDCTNLTRIDWGSFDTGSVTNMKCMFYQCSNLESIDLRNFDTKNVTDMSLMFEGCSSLTSIDLRRFDTKNVTAMYQMFYKCSNLTSIDLSSFDTGSVKYMDHMFGDCSSLTSIDLSRFDTSKVTEMSHMFNGCTKLTTIYVTFGKWKTDQAQRYSMFTNCGTNKVTYK